MTATTNTNNLRLHKTRISLIVKQILAFVSSSNLAREVENKSPNFKQIALRCLNYQIFSFGEIDPFYR